jgi:hypothetical protein
MKTFTPSLQNIIFYDGEFTSLNPYTGELLSVAFVRPDGEEFYIEIEPKGDLSEWDKENVVPYLLGNFISRQEAKQRISDFLGTSQPYLVCFVPQYDIVFLNKLFGVGDTSQDNLPYHWMPIDFASILFSLGINPHHYSDGNPELFRMFEIDLTKYQRHNALDDAKLLKESYQKIARN